MPARHRTWAHQIDDDCRRSSFPRRPSNRRESSPPLPPVLFKALGWVMLIAFVMLAFATLYTVAILDWRYTAMGYCFMGGFGIFGFLLAVGWLPSGAGKK
jgi:hypothetical protein